MSGYVSFNCDYCGTAAEKRTGEYNRAKKRGMKLFCNRACAGMSRRTNKTHAQKVEEKRIYDQKYRRRNLAKITARKAEYHRNNYDPEKARIQRKKRMPKHLEYCRTPSYRAWKKEYDRVYRAKKLYGEFWESHILTLDIRDAALARMSDYEIRLEKGTLSKTTKRKREYERTKRKELEAGALGNLERCPVGENGTGTGGLRGLTST